MKNNFNDHSTIPSYFKTPLNNISLSIKSRLFLTFMHLRSQELFFFRVKSTGYLENIFISNYLSYAGKNSFISIIIRKKGLQEVNRSSAGWLAVTV